MSRRTVTVILVCLLAVIVISAAVFALIQHKKNQIPEQVPAQKPDENTTADSVGEDSEPEYEDINKSEGLKYSLNDDGSGYIVVGIGTCMDRDIVIPDVYKDRPVVAIGDGAFAGVTIGSVSFSTTITSIGSKAFVGCNGLDIFFYGSTSDWKSIDIAEDWDYQSTCKVWLTKKPSWEIEIPPTDQ